MTHVCGQHDFKWRVHHQRHWQQTATDNRSKQHIYSAPQTGLGKPFIASEHQNPDTQGSRTQYSPVKQLRLLECFHQRCLHSVLNFRRQNLVTNIEVLERAQAPAWDPPCCFVCALVWACLTHGGHQAAESCPLQRAVSGEVWLKWTLKCFKGQLRYQLTVSGLDTKTRKLRLLTKAPAALQPRNLFVQRSLA